MMRRFTPTAEMLVRVLRDPEAQLPMEPAQWTGLISIARAESLIGTLACRLADLDVPKEVAPILIDARESAELAKTQALWEADCAQRALAGTDAKVVLMKGTAYVAADLQAGIGRSIGDLDIMVAQDKMPEVEEALLDAGWEWVKADPYDDAYYRDHMHELPPMIHRERDRMIDVHHTILPLTARPTPDASAMLDDALRLENGLYVMAPEDMLLHSVAHLFADGDLAGGLRNLWDINCLVREFQSENEELIESALHQAERHDLKPHLARAFRLAHNLYGLPVPPLFRSMTTIDTLFRRRLLARDHYGRETRTVTRQAFYIRSHWLRMPPFMLAKHLWTKWRKGRSEK